MTGVDSSAVVSFVKVLRLAEASGFEVVFTGTSDPVRAQLARGGVEETPGLVSFEPDLDRGLERCEDALLMDLVPGERTVPVLEGLPPHLWEYFERVSLEEGTKLIEQGEAPDDVYVLESGRLRVELVTPGATQMRVSTVLPGVIVGEVALYPGPAYRGRRRRDAVRRLAAQPNGDRADVAEEPQLAGLLHRWFAQTLAVRLSDRTRALDSSSTEVGDQQPRSPATGGRSRAGTPDPRPVLRREIGRPLPSYAHVSAMASRWSEPLQRPRVRSAPRSSSGR